VRELVETADVGLIVGTSLQVNPFKKWVDCVGIPMIINLGKSSCLYVFFSKFSNL
jgi:NAD-dependent SIR2 family protein deacetylase